MAKEALDLWSEELAKAFRGSGPDVTERSVFGGRAFLVGGTLVAVVENVSGQLRTRFREDLRAELEGRTHFNPASPLPMLLVVTEDDRDYAISLAPMAYDRARNGSPRPAATTQRTVGATAAEPVRRRRAR
ncbi:MAG: TfoX/Sxy family protein [Chloroflexi bacterium]|nr:MAG: TfoX/Sxy family protein [Chloroflexota bacterium]